MTCNVANVQKKGNKEANKEYFSTYIHMQSAKLGVVSVKVYMVLWWWIL